MSLIAVVGYIFQFAALLLKAHGDAQLTKEQADAAVKATIEALTPVGDPS